MLGTTAAVGQLALLKLRVKFGPAQIEIEKAFTKAAEASICLATRSKNWAFHRTVSRRSESEAKTWAIIAHELVVAGSDAQLRWFDEKNKHIKTVPARVKTDHKEDLTELQQALKDIQAMLPAQRDRIDSMFLLNKSWPFDPWRNRYLDHPLVGTIARRLIWCIDGIPAMLGDGKPTDMEGRPVAYNSTAQVTLWHPVGRSVDEILAWRRRIEESGVTQPFKQAHRELYLLTDAERNTRTYSNRFAAHIIRQHQFNALCATRRWKNKLRLMVDESEPPATRAVPEWGLRAEFWIEGAGEDEATDTNDSGVFLRLATDQVRFYRLEAAAKEARAGGGGLGRCGRTGSR